MASRINARKVGRHEEPNLWSEDNVRKVLGENLLRVAEAVCK